MYTYRALEGVNLPQLAQCLNLAFSDYEQPISFTPESLQYYLTASAVDLSLSFGAFCGEELVAVILNSGGVYKNENVVFDAGTGVIPDHRGKKVFSALFDYTCARLQSRGIAKYYLEALQSNHHAVSIYSKKGFCVSREYSVLVASGAGEGSDRVAVAPYLEFLAFETRYSVAPSFEHTAHTIGRNPRLYEVRYLQDKAYCIYAKRHGAIVQLHYNDLEALKEVVSALVAQYPTLMAKNVDCGCEAVIQMLLSLGFAEVTKQYEMVREI
ncbi:MAG: GNAT family N-acetyltransferase [Oscillospiraceae bacterium]|nr:GNAT family N-acetyltransferase [Oscillospiraceae bacterium]